jgi:hypothetical protein
LHFHNYSINLRPDLWKPQLRAYAGLFAIEVKNTRKVRSRDLAALRSFAADYPEAHRALVYRGTDTLLVDGISCLPAEKFLQRLQPDTPPLPG